VTVAYGPDPSGRSNHPRRTAAATTPPGARCTPAVLRFTGRSIPGSTTTQFAAAGRLEPAHQALEHAIPTRPDQIQKYATRAHNSACTIVTPQRGALRSDTRHDARSQPQRVASMDRSGPTGDFQDGSDLFLLTCLGSHHEASTTEVYKSWWAIGHRTAVSHTAWLPLTGPPGHQPLPRPSASVDVLSPSDCGLRRRCFAGVGEVVLMPGS